MAWTHSSNLRSIWYNRGEKILTVEFHGGRAYRYGGVPEVVYDELMLSPSKGRYFHMFIRTRYPFQRIR